MIIFPFISLLKVCIFLGMLFPSIYLLFLFMFFFPMLYLTDDTKKFYDVIKDLFS